jgi:hypothetical protein
LTERINLILVRNPVTAAPRRLGPVLAWLVGPPLQTPRFGPGPSELTGVVARLRMPLPVSVRQ